MLKPKNNYLDKLNLPVTLKKEVENYADEKCNGNCKLALIRLLKLGVLEWESS